MSKALIVYGTRYGATADTSKIIADALRQEGFEVRVVNARAPTCLFGALQQVFMSLRTLNLSFSLHLTTKIPNSIFFSQ
jgi:flavorubredoxin